MRRQFVDGAIEGLAAERATGIDPGPTFSIGGQMVISLGGSRKNRGRSLQK
jgi:hypothetical protein